MGDYQVRFCERLGLKRPCLLDRFLERAEVGTRAMASLKLKSNVNFKHVLAIKRVFDVALKRFLPFGFA